MPLNKETKPNQTLKQSNYVNKTIDDSCWRNYLSEWKQMINIE